MAVYSLQQNLLRLGLLQLEAGQPLGVAPRMVRRWLGRVDGTSHWPKG
jgi:hypothetical protein